MNVIYLRYKGRETGFPPAETTFELVHCLLPSSGCSRKTRKREKRENEMAREGKRYREMRG